MAPCGMESGRGQEWRKTCLLPSEPRQPQAVLQVWPVIEEDASRMPLHRACSGDRVTIVMGRRPLLRGDRPEVLHRLAEVVCDSKNLFRGQHEIQSVADHAAWQCDTQSEGDAFFPAEDGLNRPIDDRSEGRGIVLLHGIPRYDCAFSEPRDHDVSVVPTPDLPEALLMNGQAVTTSSAIDNNCNMRHDDVIRKARSRDCAPKYRIRKLTETGYDRTPLQGVPAIALGFSFL